tara:strand:+ start:721 stop:1566 length:846 start_codon:yes stop_codon:yes gene_type:complete
MECDVELQAKGTSEGSLVVDALLQFAGDANDIFSNLDNYLEFAKLFGKEYWNEAVEHFNTFETTQDTLNDYFSKKPLDLAIASACLTKLFLILRKIGKDKKLKSDEEIISELSDDVPERIAQELLVLLKKKSIYKAIAPLVGDVAKSIEIDTSKEFKNPVVRIDQENFQDFLTDDDQILPDYENGMTYSFDGEITSIKSTRGDSMTFHTKIGEKTYNLDLNPSEGHTTKFYLEYYQENVHLHATIIRKSLYKKPKLRLHKIELNQAQLELKKDEQDESDNG